MATAAVMPAGAIGTTLPMHAGGARHRAVAAQRRDAVTAAALPAVGSTVRVTTHLTGLSLDGVLSAMNLVAGTITLHTRRFAKPLTLSVANIRSVAQLAPPTAAFLDAQAAIEARRAHDTAAAIASLVQAVKAVPAVPPAVSDAAVSSRSSSPSPPSASSLSVSSPSFVPASAAPSSPPQQAALPRMATTMTTNAVPVSSSPPRVYRVMSAPVAVPVARYAAGAYGAHPQQYAVSMTLPHQQHRQQVTRQAMPHMNMNMNMSMNMSAPMPMRAVTVSAGATVPVPMMAAPPTSVVATTVPAPTPATATATATVTTAPATAPSSATGTASSTKKSSRRAKLDDLCKYFNTPKGCSRGTACRYRHDRVL